MLTHTEGIRQARPGLSVATALFRGLRPSALPIALAPHLEPIAARIRAETSAIEARVNPYTEFFQKWGYPCPLPGQVRSVQTKGFPGTAPLVQALLMGETLHGVLLGVQDWDLIKQPLLWDTACSGEAFSGFRGRVHCLDGEPVLRDDLGLVASYFQGPDRRTAVTAATRSACFFAFGAPGLPDSSLMEALEFIAEMVRPACEAVMGPTISFRSSHVCR